MTAGSYEVIGESAAWREVLKRASQVAATEATVLLQGDSGTGKEVVARFIHRTSPRRDGPFIGINCAALPETLLESELFGYERGAFTGAQQMKPGQIELASNGVLFLDEVTEMSPSAQAKFLRVLQEREFHRLGGTRLVKANMRVIAATNRDLRRAVERGAFRADLYYRLQVFDIIIPPLRDRIDDIPPLVHAFMRELSQTLGRSPLRMRLTDDAEALLLTHDWPGNVRELRNVLERAAILSDGGPITPEHLAFDTRTMIAPTTPAMSAIPVPAPAVPAMPPAPFRSTAPVQPAQPARALTDLKAVERRTIEHVLRETDGNKAKAARLLGLSRSQLYVRLRRYELDRRPAA